MASGFDSVYREVGLCCTFNEGFFRVALEKK